MKKILLLGTGGTIASEPHNTGLSPELSPEQLLSFVPGISSRCRVESRSLFSVDSTNMTPIHWVPSPRRCVTPTTTSTALS